MKKRFFGNHVLSIVLCMEAITLCYSGSVLAVINVSVPPQNTPAPASRNLKINDENIIVYRGADGREFVQIEGREGVFPIEELSRVSTKISSAKAPHPAISDRMIINTAMDAYSAFTYETLSILNGRRAQAALGGAQANLLQTTHPARLMASIDEGQVEQQSDDDEGYLTRTANMITNTPWFSVFQVYGHFSSQDKDDNAAGYKASGYGLQGALLGTAGEQWLFGVYLAWQSLNAEVRNAEGEIDVGTMRVGPTLAWSDGSWSLQGLITYNWNNIDNKYGGSKSDYKSNQWDGYVRGGYDFDLSGLTPGLMFTPEAHFMYARQTRDNTKSSWLGSQKSATSSGWVSRLGGMLSYDRFEIQQPVELRLAAGWQHNDFKTADLEASKVGKQDCNYKDQNSMYYSAGVDTLLNDQFNLNISYAGNWSSKSYNHFIQAAVEFRF